MCSFQNAFRLYIATCLALLLTFFAKAEEGTIESLEWQLPTSQAYSSETIRVSIGKQAAQAQSFSGKVSVSGQTGQAFVVCAQRLSSDDFVYGASIATSATFSDTNKAANIHVLTLTETAGSLNIEQGYPCPEGFDDQYPFTSEQYIQSEKPFLVSCKRGGKVKENHNPDFFPLSDSIKQQPWLRLSGSGYAADDHSDFKRPPPFMPALDKAQWH